MGGEKGTSCGAGGNTAPESSFTGGCTGDETSDFGGAGGGVMVGVSG
jgi:hypothetical protein